MTEEQEKQEQPRPQPVKEQVKRLVEALKFAGNVDSYKAEMQISERNTQILVNGGQNTARNAVFEHYILKAERQFIKESAVDIVELAKVLLDQDIEEIRGLLK